MPFSFKKLLLSEVILIESKSFLDNRGFFLENFKKSEFEVNGIFVNFNQDNLSHSIKGVLRGLHYQKLPKPQAKLVTAIRGEIFDVAVDIRKNSPNFGRWVSQILSDKNHFSMYIPEGFAHGFCTLSETADVLYKVTNEYSSENERGIIWNDPTLKINWPIENPIMTKKDLELPQFSNIDNNFFYTD